MSITTTCYIGVGGLYVASELLGRSFEAEADGSSVGLSIPSFEDYTPTSSWGRDLPQDTWPILGSTVRWGELVAWHEVLVMRAVVKTEANVRVRDPAGPDDFFSPAEEQFEREKRKAARLLRDTLQGIRVSAGQYWLAMTGQPLPILRADLIDSEGQCLTSGPASLVTGGLLAVGTRRAPP